MDNRVDLRTLRPDDFAPESKLGQAWARFRQAEASWNAAKARVNNLAAQKAEVEAWLDSAALGADEHEFACKTARLVLLTRALASALKDEEVAQERYNFEKQTWTQAYHSFQYLVQQSINVGKQVIDDAERRKQIADLIGVSV